jgi:hypothetical protein
MHALRISLCPEYFALCTTPHVKLWKINGVWLQCYGHKRSLPPLVHVLALQIQLLRFLKSGILIARGKRATSAM